jgi:hypothetical protein
MSSGLESSEFIDTIHLMYSKRTDSMERFLMTNTLEWQEDYEVFGSIDFEHGALVKAQTNVMGIDFGACRISFPLQSFER